MSRVLQIENLGKSYQIGEYRGFGVQNKKERIDALQNVSFEVNRGEVVGIIGKNGAGKSTLLKLLSQITMPSTGIIRARGKIASLLEVGTGMHPDLTGRENIFLNGAILGMSKAEIKSKFDEIVQFSGCEAFIDTPIKRYSSGMKVRLGFSVAAFLDSEIIIIDEVLAVGDAEFQSKAIQKISEITADGSKTILFVSHNMASVKSLCSRCLLLEKGKLIFDGNIDKAISKYMGYDTQMSERTREWNSESAPGNVDYKLRAARIVAGGKTFEEPLSTSDTISIEVEIESLNNSERLDVTFQLMSEAGEFLAATSTFQIPDSELEASENGKITLFSCVIPSNVFNQSTYRINCLLLENRKTVVHRFDELFKLGFTAAERDPETWMGHSKSHFLPQLNWTITSK